MKPILVFLGLGLLFVGLCCGAFAGFAKFTDDAAAKSQANMREITFEELKEKPPRAGVQFKLTEFNLITDGYLTVSEVTSQSPADDNPDLWGSSFVPLVGVDDPVDLSNDLSFDYVLRSNMVNTEQDALDLAQEPFLICSIGKGNLDGVLRQYSNNPHGIMNEMYLGVDLGEVVVLQHTATPAIPGGSGVDWFCFAVSGAILLVAIVMLGLGIFLPSGPSNPAPHMPGTAVASAPAETWPQPMSMPPPSQPTPPIDRDPGGGEWSPSEQVDMDSPQGSSFSDDAYAATMPDAPGSYIPSPPIGSAYAPARVSGFAIGSLICGILGIFACCLFLPSIAAVVCGHISLAHMKQGRGSITGRNLGIAGLVLGYLGIVLGIAYIVMLIAVPATP